METDRFDRIVRSLAVTPTRRGLARLLAAAVLAAAAARTETRGAHSRVEHPDADPTLAVRFVIGG